MTAFQKYLSEFTFAPTSKVSKLLKSGKAPDIELAAACKTTKAYKEDQILVKRVEEVLSTASVKQPEPAQKQDARMGESRRW